MYTEVMYNISYEFNFSQTYLIQPPKDTSFKEKRKARTRVGAFYLYRYVRYNLLEE